MNAESTFVERAGSRNRPTGPILLVMWLLMMTAGEAVVLGQPDPAWNRRVTGVSVVSSPAGDFDVTVEWRIDLEGSSTPPVEVGTDVDLSIGGGLPTTTTSDDCVIWDLQNGGGFDCTGQPDGTTCGTASISGTPVSLTCDADTDTCSTPSKIATFPGVPLTTGDVITVILRPAPNALPDSSPNDDDDGRLTFGTWNRKLVSLDIVPTPGAPADTFDITAQVLIEKLHAATVPLDLSIDTVPVAGECCDPPCCCPPCSTECGGTGCGNDVNLTWPDVPTEDTILAGLCPALGCAGSCGSVTGPGGTVAANCDAVECVCRSDLITLTWLAMPFQPGDEITVILRPSPGALPELPGFEDDEMAGFAPGPIPAVSDWGVVAMALMILIAGSAMWRGRTTAI